MDEQSNSSLKDFFYEKEVAGGCYRPIREIFDTLLLSKQWTQSDLAKEVFVDKSVISRVCNGIHIPTLELRLKIAKALGVDSSLIWRYQDLPYLRQILKQGRQEK